MIGIDRIAGSALILRVTVWPSMIGNWTSNRVQLSDRCTLGEELQGDPRYEALFQTGEHSVLGRRIENTKADRHTPG
jgi:hypothetical protein